MTVPTISNLPTVPATSDPNFETEAPALFNHIKNTFVSEMNSAISFINSSTFDATVEFKNANFTAARNFLYMIDTSSAGVSVTLPLNPSTGDQLLLMDQKRSFGTNNLTIVRNGQNINGAASNVVSKSTGALIRCIFQSSYGWTVDLYEGEWESGTNAGDLVYNGGNVGIGTSSPESELHVKAASNRIPVSLAANEMDDNSVCRIGLDTGDSSIYFAYGDAGDAIMQIANSAGTTAQDLFINPFGGKVGIGTSAPGAKLEVESPSGAGNTNLLTLLRGGGYGQTTFNQFYNTGVSPNPTLYGLNFGLDVSNDTNGKVGIKFESTTSGQTSSDKIYFKTANTNQMVIDNAGNVGIGTSSPTRTLEIADSTSDGSGGLKVRNFLPVIELEDFSGGKTQAKIQQDALAMKIGPVNSSTTLSLLTENAERLHIDRYGKVGIGTNSPGANLDLRGGLSNTAGGFQFGMGSSTSSYFGIRLDTSGDVCFDTYKAPWTETLKIDRSSGDFEISTGNLVIGTAGKGIDFSANSHFGGTGGGTGMSSELFDSYEEGNWTPTIEATGTAPTVTYTVNTGSYVKIGRMVHVTMSIVVNAFSGGTGDIRIAGLPFNSISSDSNKYSSSGAIGYASGFTTKPHVALLISTDTNKIRLYDDNNGAIAISTLGGGEVIRLTISYQTAS